MNAKVSKKKAQPEPVNPITRALELQQRGEVLQAEAAFRAILQANPNEAVSIYSLGIILLGRGEWEAALALFRHGCETSPTFAYNWFGYASTLQALGRSEESLLSYDEAIKAKPDYIEALVNSGVLLRDMYRHHEALTRFNRVLEIDPNYPNALGNCAILLTEFKESAKAIALLERLLVTTPDYDYGLGLLLYERLHIGDWSGFDSLRQQIIDGVRAGQRVCKSLAFMAISDNAADHFACAKIFAEHYCPPAKGPLWKGEQYGHKRLRIAYVSPDLREHPVGHLMCGIFEQHDKSRVETIAISLGIDDKSRLRQRMLAAFDHFIDVRGWNSQRIAEKMREMEVDIAIDLAGYTSDSRIDLFSWRPAPVHINFLGYPGTLAVDYMDYILADRHIIPPEHQAYYSEKVLYLPDAYLPTDGNLAISELTPSRESCGLPPSGAVFCSFSHDYKIAPPLWKVWMSLLQKTPGSVLWLVARNELTQANFRRAAEAYGIAPERLIFAGRVPRVEDHLARYRLADVFLDTWPYNAHTTAADALIAGLPVVTYMGGAFPARVAGSLLHAIGLPELVTHSWADYEALALNLVSDRGLLADIKRRLGENKKTHALFDTGRFCRNLEDVLFSVAKTPLDDTPAVELPDPALSEPAALVGLAALASELESAAQLIAEGNYPQAELHVRRYQRSGGTDGRAARLLEQIAHGYGLTPGFLLSEKSLPVAAGEKYLFIRAWGYGFWSDVHHVLGQLLVAELTHRVPLIWWGENSLFGDPANPNAFELYFQPVAQRDLRPQLDRLSIYPAKWNPANLYGPAVNAWQGADSRMAAPFFFDRPEDVVVSDFYATVASIQPWIATDSSYYGLSDDEIYARLCEKYLRPTPTLSQKAEAFYQQHMAGRHWVAVHVRGSDKVHESPELHQTNLQYFGFVDRIVELNPQIGVFLLTDSLEVHDAYRARYGDRLVATPALRTDSNVGIHLQGHAGYAVGEEVMVDVLLATRGSYFIGNKESNVSLAIASLKRWPANFMFLLGEKSGRSENWFLYRGHSRPLVACRLCNAPLELAFERQLLARYPVKYYRCTGCAALQTEKPYWLGEAYSGQAERFDTGKASRTLANFLLLPRLLEILGIEKSDRGLDFGSGTGLLTRLMRDIGYDFFAYDKYGAGEFAGAYLWQELAHRCRLVTMFEVAEHFDDPLAEWGRIFALDPEIVIGSTGLYQGQGADWNYLSPESGQHIFFYSLEALTVLAAKFGRTAYLVGMYFIFAKKPLEAAALADIQVWREGLYAAGKTTFDQWLGNPYANAVRDNGEMLARTRLRNGGLRIAIDGVFFRFNTGISRVWRSLLSEWSATGFAEFLVVIDRQRTAPRFPGIRYIDAPQHDYADIAADQRLLQAICDQEGISLFISTYYTTPLTTPAALMVLDMIPEVMGFDLQNPQWLEKHRTIRYARKYLSISESTARDLRRFFPEIPAENVLTTYCGSDFRKPALADVERFKQKFAIERPYFLISGVRTDYKNVLLFFKAFAELGEARRDFAIVCTNSNYALEPAAAALVGEAAVHMVVLSDAELQCAYRGAIALVYPSRYEGFGLPVLEAMACACPVITCRISSLPEVGGDAVRYVDPDDPAEMLQAIREVQNAESRQELLQRGEIQAKRFSWAKMAREVEQALSAWAVEFSTRPEKRP
ncbi:MAG: putative O-linked N-acetylglucosamine transferase, family [Proteobacteria bacterium]|nr:putative O-linked N-acetylglucosamine transferase, family [Pseudomonadota bacterium]